MSTRTEVKHTPGPWTIDFKYYTACVNDGSQPGWTPPFPIGHCAFCSSPDGSLIKEYVEGGLSMHLHRFSNDDGRWHDVWSVNGEIIVGNYDYEEGGVCSSKADAYLIAAAPELLEALESIQSHWQSGNFSRRQDLWDAMDAAIRKARGSQ